MNQQQSLMIAVAIAAFVAVASAQELIVSDRLVGLFAVLNVSTTSPFAQITGRLIRFHHPSFVRILSFCRLEVSLREF